MKRLLRAVMDIVRLRAFLFALIVANLVVLTGIHMPTQLPDELTSFIERRGIRHTAGDAAGISLIPTTSENTGAAVLTRVCANGSKSAYTQVIASTANTVKGILLTMQPGASNEFVDLATGGAGSETVVIGNLYAAGATYQTVEIQPFLIAAGTRIAIRCQDAAANTLTFSVTLIE